MSTRRWRYTPIVLLAGLMAADWDLAACPDCFHEGYEIDLSSLGLLSTPPAAVLFSGYRNGRCEDDLICTAAGDLVWLGDLGWATSYNYWGNSCSDREMVVFAGGHAPTPLRPTMADVPPITPTLAPPAILSLAVWVKGSDPTLGVDVSAEARLSDANGDLVNTQQIFDMLGAGITLDYTVKPLPWVIPETVKDIYGQATCDLAQTLMEGVNETGGRAEMQDPSKLNVYFVDSLKYALDGQACYGAKNPKVDRYVIFVAQVGHMPSTLAHEIGHTLGLVMRATMPNGSEGMDEGDVNELALDPYLPVDNLMYSGVGNVGQITVGEIYRMHFDQRSWLWHNGTPGGGYPLDCQPSPVAGGPCPPLTLHPVRGWP
jgi:hypothetical protein